LPTPSKTPSGQALVEFALILPILLFIVVGGIGLGITVVHRIQLQHAAGEVATEAASTDCSAALNRVDELLGYHPDAATCTLQAQLVTVDLTHSYPALIPGLPESIHVTSRALTR
jgi:hypothetical protein